MKAFKLYIFIAVIFASAFAYSAETCSALFLEQNRTRLPDIYLKPIVDPYSGASISRVQAPRVLYSWVHIRSLEFKSSTNPQFRPENLLNPFSHRKNRPTMFASDWPQFAQDKGLFTWSNPTATRGAMGEDYGQVLVRIELKPEVQALFLQKSQNNVHESQFRDALPTEGVDLVLNSWPREWIILNPKIINKISMDPRDFSGEIKDAISKLEDPSYKFKEEETHYGSMTDPASSSEPTFGLNDRNYSLFRLKQFLKLGSSLVPPQVTQALSSKPMDKTNLQTAHQVALAEYAKAEKDHQFADKLLSLKMDPQLESESGFNYYVRDGGTARGLLKKSYEGLILRSVLKLVSKGYDKDTVTSQVENLLSPLIMMADIRIKEIRYKFDEPVIEQMLDRPEDPLHINQAQFKIYLEKLSDPNISLKDLFDGYLKVFEKTKTIGESVDTNQSMIKALLAE